jgi:WD40 repeat protein
MDKPNFSYRTPTIAIANYIGQRYIYLVLLLLFTSACSYIKYDGFTSNSQPAIGFYKQRAFKAHAGSVYDLVITTDGKTIISCGSDRQIKLWELATGKLLKTFNGHSESVNQLAIGLDNKILASGSWDKTIKIWDLERGTVKHSLTGHEQEINSLIIDSEAKTLISGGYDGKIKFWDLNTGKLQQTINAHYSWVNALVVTSNGKTLISGGSEGKIKFWDLSTKNLQKEIEDRYRSLRELAISSDNSFIASAYNAGNDVKIWDLNTGTLQKTIETEDSAASQLFSINGLAISRNRQFLVTGSGNSKTKIWNLASATQEQNITSSTSPVFALTLSFDDKILAIGRQDGSIEIWRLLEQ